MINAKTAKLIRKSLPHWRMAIHETFTVASTKQRYVTTIRERTNPVTGEVTPARVLKDTALQVRLQAGCPKNLYKRMKRYMHALQR